MLLKCCINMSSNLENPAGATGLEKVSFHSNPKKGNAKECSNYCELISQASKVMLKSFRLSFNSTWVESFLMCKLDLEKAEEQEIKLPTFAES